MRVSPEVVRHIAGLARLRVPEARVAAFAADLTAILNYADQLGAVEGLDLAAASGGAPGVLVQRADAVETPLGPAGLMGAADRQGDEVRVPTVVGEAP